MEKKEELIQLELITSCVECGETFIGQPDQDTCDNCLCQKTQDIEGDKSTKY